MFASYHSNEDRQSNGHFLDIWWVHLHSSRGHRWRSLGHPQHKDSQLQTWWSEKPLQAPGSHLNTQGRTLLLLLLSNGWIRNLKHTCLNHCNTFFSHIFQFWRRRTNSCASHAKIKNNLIILLLGHGIGSVFWGMLTTRSQVSWLVSTHLTCRGSVLQTSLIS